MLDKNEINNIKNLGRLSGVKVMMLLDKCYKNDARVERSIKTLAAQGYVVLLVSVLASGTQAVFTKIFFDDGACFFVMQIKVTHKRLIVYCTAYVKKQINALCNVMGFLQKYKNILKRIKVVSKKMPRNFLVTNLLRPIIGFMFYFSAKVSLLPGLFRKFCIKYRLRERVLRYVFPVRVRRLRYQLFAEDCVKIAKNFKPDIIHAHDFPCLIAANLVSKVLNVPYIYDTHELWCERNRVNTKRIHFDKRWELRKEKALVRMAASTITVCDSISDYLYKRFNAKRPVVLRNVPYRRNPGFNLNMRAKLGMRDSDFLAIYIGKATFGRGILDIVRALPKVDSRVKFICLGYFSPQFRLVFDRQVKKQNLQERVFTFGPVEPHEVAGYASCCDLSLTTMSQICLSYLYTLPNKLFESIQAGLPIIGPNSPEIINIVQNYECGLTYSDGNHTDLANKINLLVNSPDQLKILKMNSVKAAETLCWEKEQEGLIDLYSKICHEG